VYGVQVLLLSSLPSNQKPSLSLLPLAAASRVAPLRMKGPLLLLLLLPLQLLSVPTPAALLLSNLSKMLAVDANMKPLKRSGSIA
jgi:hypothetical protein